MDSFRIKNKEQFLNDVVKYTEQMLDKLLDQKENAYRRYKKKDGRIIYSVNHGDLLYGIQNNLQNLFFLNIMFPECVYGFRKRRNYYDFLTPHISSVQNRYFLRLDIKHFFDSIRLEDIKESLNYYFIKEINSEEKEWIINHILGIVTLDNQIIQGAVTSPTLSNLIFRSLDIRIEKYCKKLGIIYSRYADDMLFSSNMSYIHNYRFTNMIAKIISEKGFSINHKKTLKYKNEISLNGYVVGCDIRLSRKKLRQLNKIIFEMSKSSFTGFQKRKSKYVAKNKLAGYRAFLIQSLKYINNETKLSQVKNKIKKIEVIITKYCTE